MALRIYSPDDNAFIVLDEGRTAEYTLFLNILIEQRVTNMLLAQYIGDGEELSSMRADAVSDPSSLKQV
jgi:hypothetical protein